MRVSQLVGTLGPVNHSRLHQGCTKRVTAKQTITEGTDTKTGTEGKQFVVDVATLLKTNKQITEDNIKTGTDEKQCVVVVAV